MRKIPLKNYLILSLLLTFTMFITLLVFNLYSRENNKVSSFYEYCNKITSEDLNVFVLENSDSMVYISSKRNLDYAQFERNFKKRLDDLNIKDKLVFIDKDDIEDSFYNNLNKKYNKKIDFKKNTILLLFDDKKIKDVIYIDAETDANSFIDYGAFK